MNVVSRNRLGTKKFEIFPVALTFFFFLKGRVQICIEDDGV